MAHFYDPEPVDGGKAYGVAQDETCPTCAGTGRELPSDERPDPHVLPVHKNCRFCGGTGRRKRPA